MPPVMPPDTQSPAQTQPDVVRREPYGDSPRVGARGTNTQKAILEAALEVFRDHGFHATRVELITEAAGCSRPAFYQYFSSKDDVYWKLARELAGHMTGVADSIGPSTADRAGVDDIAAWLERLIDVRIWYGPIVDAFPTAFREPTERFTRAPGLADQLGIAIIASSPDRRRFAAVPAIAGVTSTVTMRAIHHWHHQTSLPRATFVTALAELLHRLLHGPIAGVNTPPPSAPPARKRLPVPAFDGIAGVVEPARPRGRATRDRLLTAAVGVLSQRGYHEARVDDIVEEAAVSHGSFYRYFPSKEAVFGVVAEKAFRELFELISAFPAVDALDELRPWLERFFQSYEDNGGIVTAWQEIDLEDPALRDYTMGVSLAVFDQLARIIRTRGFGPASIDALSLVALIEQIPYTVGTLHYLEASPALDASDFFVQRAIFGTA